jgi:hypothetical protein
VFGAASAATTEWLKADTFCNLVASTRPKAYRFAMKVIIHLTKEDETKALPILLRHSPGMVLPNRTYVLSEDALKALRARGIHYSEVSREAASPSLEEAAGERV